MVLDGEYLKNALLEATKEGVSNGLAEIQHRAREKAPVRDIFRHPRGKSVRGGGKQARSNAVASMVEHLGGSFPTAISSRSMKLRDFGLDFGGGYPIRQGKLVERGGGTPHVSAKRIIRGRYNSYAPVVPSPAGLIGAEEFREWRGNNRLAIGNIRSRSGTFSLESLLSSRGRYEAFGEVKPGGKRAGKGRAVITVGGEQRIGGRLRESIVPEGPFIRGNEVYGFVRAAASDPGSNHNYAADQEFGTRRHRAQPFLRPGLRESKDKIIKMVDPRSGHQRGIIQRAFQMGSRPSGAANDIGVVYTVRVTSVGWGGVSKKFLNALLGGG
jgi:hypothetical protein